MPISNDIKQFYPDNWQEIREEVLERAANRSRTEYGHAMIGIGGPCCEWCGRPNGATVPVVGDEWEWRIATIRIGDEPELPDYIEVRNSHGKVVDEGDIVSGPTWVSRIKMYGTKTVLTIAHLDHDPRGDNPDRLRALCQRCHLTYDNQPEQRAMRKRIYAELRGQGTLFEVLK